MRSINYIPRSIENYAFDEGLTGRHMVFLAGPRQVGKTLLAKKWLKKKECSPLYYNWDDVSTRRAYLGNSRFFESPARALAIRDPWIVFDEIHKRNRWRDILKGVFDLFEDEFRFLITGSARLDLFRHSGDSLVGRYNLFHMLPFNIGEITNLHPAPGFLGERDPYNLARKFEEEISRTVTKEVTEAFQNLSRLGPFPEPFLRQNERFSRKWHQDYFTLVIRQDLKDISKVGELDKVENLLLLMPTRITSPLSMANLARELEVSHTTVKRWLEELRRLYLLFPVPPWTRKISRGLKKENKWYFLDWYYAAEGPARLENMAAAYLHRACLAMTDMGYGDYRLHYVRTLDKQELDFVITVDNHPIVAIEVKTGETAVAKTLRNREKWFPKSPTLGVQLVDKRGVLEKHPDNTWVVSAERLLAILP
jgi:predicted AAA+ superfamily ATPase